MKIRLGFVSNSSSTSFCIYGISVSVRDFLDKFNLPKIISKDLKKSFNRLIKETDYNISYDDVELLNKIIFYSLNDNSIEYYVDCSSVNIGKSLILINDNETGLEFKISVEKSLNKLFKEQISYDYIMDTIES
jgi:hypothetical protein